MKSVVSDFWEEHCIECGAPACYGTCEKYQAGPGGLCKRIDDGRFLPWGKLELYWQGRLTDPWKKKLIGGLVAILRPMLMGLGKGFLYRGIRRHVTALVGRKAKPRVWKIECATEKNEALMATISNLQKEDLFIKRLDLKVGTNAFKIDLPDLPTGVFFKLSSVTGTAGRVVFKTNEIGVPEDYGTRAEFVKCVVWDLDNTLWRGILANDGAEGVALREEVIGVIKALDERGIVSSICSKNEYKDAWAKLESLGIAEYFVFPRINWNPKSENIKKIAKDINIGLNTLAFIDDSAHERGEVGENLPMVRVFDERNVKKLLDLREFNPPTSSESGNRRLSYLAEMKRRQDEEDDSGNHEDFIRKCRIKLTCLKIEEEATRKRCWELVNRTNQLTLAAHRYTEEEFAALVVKSDCRAIKCEDKYGDYGIVGFIAVEGERVREFVMSCRVAKKYCEQSVLFAFAREMKNSGSKTLSAEVVSTGRNIALIEAFDAMPFEKKTKGAKIEYRLDLEKDISGIYCNETRI